MRQTSFQRTCKIQSDRKGVVEKVRRTKVLARGRKREQEVDIRRSKVGGGTFKYSHLFVSQ